MKAFRLLGLLSVFFLTIASACAPVSTPEEYEAQIAAEPLDENAALIAEQERRDRQTAERLAVNEMLPPRQASLPRVPPESELPILSADIEVFIAAMEEAGLNWEIDEERQKRRDEFLASFENFGRRYFNIVGPEHFASGIIIIDNLAGIYFINAFFGINRHLCHDELEYIRENGLITHEEQAGFWRLLGILLEEKETVAEIAKLVRAEYENFDFGSVHHQYGMWLDGWGRFEGTVANISYIVEFQPDSRFIPGHSLQRIWLTAEVRTVLE